MGDFIVVKVKNESSYVVTNVDVELYITPSIEVEGVISPFGTWDDVGSVISIPVINANEELEFRVYYKILDGESVGVITAIYRGDDLDKSDNIVEYVVRSVDEDCGDCTDSIFAAPKYTTLPVFTGKIELEKGSCLGCRTSFVLNQLFEPFNGDIAISNDQIELDISTGRFNVFGVIDRSKPVVFEYYVICSDCHSDCEPMDYRYGPFRMIIPPSSSASSTYRYVVEYFTETRDETELVLSEIPSGGVVFPESVSVKFGGSSVHPDEDLWSFDGVDTLSIPDGIYTDGVVVSYFVEV